MPKINGERLLADQRSLAEFGKYKTGVHRPTYSPQDMAARNWLVAQLAAAGLDASIDGIGNILARPRKPGPRLLIGSHSESQNHAGWLDGALGVVYGLEIARAFGEDSSCADFPIEVAAWADEEGHFGNFLGSRSFVGDLTEEEIDRARDHTEGTALRHALERAGLAAKKREAITSENYIGYLEAHIEQGDYLDQAGLHLGVVTGIVGIWQYRIVFAGEQNHAGTTRMAARKDAGVALVALCGAIATRFAEITGPRSVWTTGAIRLEPGQPSIVPGGAEMLFQIRDDDPAVIERLEDLLRGMAADVTAQGRSSVAVERIRTGSPALMDGAFQQAIEAASATFAGGRSIRMPSGAGHDAQVLATIMPAGMIFVPSIGGISHHWSENTDDADIVTGAQVFVEACRRLLGNQP